jgi:hypothetical protein
MLLVNVNAFTNPPTSEGPIVRCTDVVLWIEEGFGLSVGVVLRAVPSAT